MSLLVALVAPAFATTDAYTNRGDHAQVSAIVDSGDGYTYSVLTMNVYETRAPRSGAA